MSGSIKVNISEVLMNGMMDVISKVVMDLSKVYNFDGEEACRMLEIGKSVSKVKSSKSLSSKSLSMLKPVKSLFALPFNGVEDVNKCQGLRQNHGLYTQCQGSRNETEDFCKSCQSQANKNDNGKPDYGTIGDRMKAHDEGVEFKDPSGKLPTAYSIVMKKLKLTREEVESEAGKLNIKLNPIHFEEVATKKSGRPAKADKPEKTESKPKGRPKKSKKVLELAGEEEDLFASLVMSANAESNGESNGLNTPILADSDDEEKAIEEPIEEPSEEPIEEPIKKQKKNKISEEEKKALEDEKAAKKKALEDEKALKKQALEDEKALKKQALEDEKAAKKKAMEDEKAAKKKAIEDEKEAKKKAIEDEKAAKKVSEEVKPSKKNSKKEPKKDSEEEPDVVKKIEFEGKKYLKSKNTGIIYNMEQDVIGKWNEEKQRIDFNEVAEESEDEYDDDN